MTNVNLKVNGASISATLDGVLTSGMVGVPVEISYDNTWGDLSRTVVFRAGSFARDRRNVGTATTIPWEVLRHHGKVLEVGIVGKDADDNIIFPTVWVSVGTIQSGAYTTVPGAPNPDNEDDHTGGAPIDDSQISSAFLWSSRNTVDRLCPAFTESGETVSCEPVEGYPLDVVSHLEPRDTPYTEVSLWCGSKNLVGYRDHNSTQANYDQSCKGGVITKEITKAFSTSWIMATVFDEYKQSPVLIPGTYVFSLNVRANTGSYSFVRPYAVVKLADGSTVNLPNGTAVAIDQPGTVTQFRCDNSGAGFKAGQSITFTMQIERGSVATAHEPLHRGQLHTADFGQGVYGGAYNWATGVLTGPNGETHQLPQQKITALPGVNTLFSDTGNTEVAGRADPVAINAKQEARLAALEAALINT